MSEYISLLTELNVSRGTRFYKHCAPSGASGPKPNAYLYSTNLKTYLSSNAISNFRNRLKYSFLNELRW